MRTGFETLKQKWLWLVTGSFKNEQAYLRARIRSGRRTLVFLDPDGTAPDWMALLIRRKTHIIYGTQCAGVATEQRFLEGYLVPLGGSKYKVDDGNVDIAPFTDVFHQDGACVWGWAGHKLPQDRLAVLRALIENIPFWRCTVDHADSKLRLHLDDQLIEQIAEGWIPVVTPDGSGVVVYQNCD